MLRSERDKQTIGILQRLKDRGAPPAVSSVPGTWEDEEVDLTPEELEEQERRREEEEAARSRSSRAGRPVV